MQTTTFSPSEVGAATSVLLGFPPPFVLSAASSSKLNEVLMPNPFNRPRAVLMLEVTGTEGTQLILDSDNSAFSGALRIKVVGDEQRVDIQLPGDDEASLVSLNEESSDTECSDKELADFASWLGGSYVEDASQPSNGEFSFPLANGAYLRLHMSERADRKYTMNLFSLIYNIRRAMELHEVLSKREQTPAELIIGKFVGIKALQDQYGGESIAQNGLEVFITSISKIFDSLQAAYQGQICGVIVEGGPATSELETIFHVKVASQSSARWLEETVPSVDPIKIAEVAFVRMTLAWITGIILLIATLLGVSFSMLAYVILYVPFILSTLT
ncbi:hypothetical protein F511_33365 [Dorcoceras hygrometricum]|uniref:DUF7794 domain-containing protein n=1 Tax=Dorcoceras hygrometricum TaxID=472368 RepID=A0A2Z7CFF8_9LAMI|nr:hypothetical protein F511_33365 [Dorcoceras hygrometricum]